MNMNRIDMGVLIRAWLPVLAWMIVIFLFSSQPHSGAATERYFGAYNVLIRKIAHGTEYAILFVLARRAFALSGKQWQRKSSLFGLLLACVYALSDEWHQSFVPGRSAALTDAGIDAAGALFAFVIIWSRKVNSTAS